MNNCELLFILRQSLLRYNITHIDTLEDLYNDYQLKIKKYNRKKRNILF